MIQRIQTIWLTVIAILSVTLFSGGIMQFVSGNGVSYTLGFSGVTSYSGGVATVVLKSVGLPVTMILIPLLGVAAILFFKKIRIQKSAALLVIAFTLCLFIMTAWYWYTISKNYGGIPVPGVKMAFTPVMVVMAILAYRGIVKDENLLKSYDRLR